MAEKRYDMPAVRAGFAEALVRKLFPNMQHAHPKQFAADVDFIYEWETSLGGESTINDLLGLKKGGDYKDRHTGYLAAVHWMNAPQRAKLHDALQHGDVSAAKKWEQKYGNAPNIKPAKTPGGQIDSKTGDWKSEGGPGTWSQIFGAIEDVPGAIGKDVSGLGDIGGLLGNHLVLVILIIGLVLVVKKK